MEKDQYGQRYNMKKKLWKRGDVKNRNVGMCRNTYKWIEKDRRKEGEMRRVGLEER